MSSSSTDHFDDVVLTDAQFGDSMRILSNPVAGDGLVPANRIDARTIVFWDGTTRAKQALTSLDIDRKAAQADVQHRHAATNGNRKSVYRWSSVPIRSRNAAACFEVLRECYRA